MPNYTIEELEEIRFGLSHDILASARRSAQFLSLIEQSLPAEVTEPYRTHFDFASGSIKEVVAKSEAIKQLIELKLDVLSYESVDAEALLKMAFNVVRHKNQLSETDVSLLVKGVGSVTVQLAYLKYIFEEVLSNCVTYQSPDRALSITVSSVSEDTRYHFVVNDNGLGIPSEQKDHIFELFKRLHPIDKTMLHVGAGLTISRAMCLMMNGDMWVEHKDEGVSLHFTFEKP